QILVPQGGTESSLSKMSSLPEMVMIEPSGGRFRARVSICRLAVSRFGLTSPPAPFRVGAAPTDSYLSHISPPAFAALLGIRRIPPDAFALLRPPPSF